jgi:hypothetical protein
MIPVSDGRHGAPGASPYATGGGGVVLEHIYGATVLAALLVGMPLDLLGDRVMVDQIAFQARRLSPVDDLVVTGTIAGSQPIQRRIAIAVRRDPVMARSDGKFVKLVGTMLAAVAEKWDEIRADTFRLGLVVAAPHGGAQQTATLTDLARSHPSAQAFRDAVMEPGTKNRPVRERLKYLEDAVGEAAKDTDGSLSVEVLTWQLLVGLRVAAVQLQGDVAPDRTSCVGHLQRITDGPTEAASLFDRLTGLSGRYVPAGAEIDSAMLRRDLVGQTRIGGSLRYSATWLTLDGLAQRTRSRTRNHLAAEGRTLEIDRGALRTQLKTATIDASGESAGLVVTGDPDVGKSAIAVAAADELLSEGAAIHLVHLRDLPTQTLELEHLIHGPITEVLAAGPVAATRLLVIDGAEAALEGWSTIFSDLATAASRAEVQLVAVVRGDAAAAVAAAMSTDGHPAKTFFVPPFDADERAKVATSFKSLTRFSVDPRSRWLLSRPGLVDLVLRADVAATLPDGALSEADVFAAVWARLVRRDERHGPGKPSPDGREQALLALATQAITGSPAPVTDLSVLPSLRSDGLLLAAGPTAAWSGGDQFATDLVRDFSLARLLTLTGFDMLVSADAPRWAIRATVLALQARLLATRDVTATRESLQASFDGLAAAHGDRWSDLIDEATLTLGSSPAVLDQIWPTLLLNDAFGLARALRLVSQRYTENGAADPIVTGPLIDVYLTHADELTEAPHDVIKNAGKTITAFLRGLIVHGHDQTNPTRVAVRERALAAPSVTDKETVERLGLLGPDLDDRTEAALRDVADQHPHLLAKVVESPTAVVSLVRHHPDLLLTLAEAYYVEHPHPGRSPFAMTLMDDGIRRHTSMGVGFPFAGWYAGPFHRLLRVRPIETLAFINRMVDHAANLSAGGSEALIGEPAESGLDVELPHLGRRTLAGNSRVWSWYRGTTFAPYPCISALLAVEAEADASHQAGVSLETVTYRLLEHCHSLATLGLTVGFLIRHLDEVSTELDVFLTQPGIWELEFSRMVGEHGGLRAQFDEPEIHGFDKRRYNLADVARTLTVQAMLNHEEGRMATLDELADRLVANATDDQGVVEPAVHVWASGLRASSYEATPLDDGRIMLQAKPPPEIEAARESQQTEMKIANEGYRLLNTYALGADRRPSDLSRINSDIAIARQLAEHPPRSLGRSSMDAVVALAATAIIAHGEGRHRLSQDDLGWAANEIINAVPSALGSENEYSGSWYSPGADRSAAAALPSLLLPPFNEANANGGFDGADIATIRAALMDSAASPTDEVRRVAGAALAPVWAAPCHELLEGLCRHKIAYQSVEHGLRDCRLGPWAGQRRNPLPITGNLAAELATVDGEDLLIDRLTGPIEALASAVVSNVCVASHARTLLDAVLAAHRGAAIAWSGGGYTTRDEAQSPVAIALIDLHEAGHHQDLDRHVRTLLDDPGALWQFLRLLAEVATYDLGRRSTVFDIWPELMAHVFEEIGRGRDPRRTGTRKSDYRRADAIAALILRPQLKISDSDPDSTLTSACAAWIPLTAVRPEIEQWLALATGSSEALDSLVSYLRTLPAAQQIDPGLNWVDHIIAGRYSGFSSQTWHLPRWLSELRGVIPREGAPLRLFRNIVDGFANAGDNRFVAIQQAEEQGPR